ncbi:MAG: radical SAM protein [Micrococcales bacterium]|nr:radical SAM protein [Micrococcales bacterium]
MTDLAIREFSPLKWVHHIDRLRALAQGLDVAPVTVEIDPVSFCNHRCPWCVDPLHQSATLDLDLFSSLIHDLAVAQGPGGGVEGIVFKGGGEPTLHPHFDSLVEQATDLGFAVGVVTNGSRLTRWKTVLASRASYVRISVDGPTASSHHLIHQPHDFDDVITGIRDLVAARASARHPVIGLSFAMDSRTADLAEDAIALGDQLGADYVLLRPPFFEEVGRDSTMTPSQAAEVRQTLRTTAATYGGEMLVQVGDWIGAAERSSAGVSSYNPSDERGSAAGRPSVGAWSLGPSGRRDATAQLPIPFEERTRTCWASPLVAVVTADGTVFGCCNLRALPGWELGRLDYAVGHGWSQAWKSPTRAAVLDRMRRTECLAHCTHPVQRYNEVIETLRDSDPPHRQFL